MNGPRWWSQPFAPEGSVAGEGIANQLGRPALDPLEVLIREAAQNSWDARAGTGPVRFRVSIQRLGDRADNWRSALLPPPSGDSVAVSGMLTPDSLILMVSDRGTVGLGGPLRAGTKAGEGERSDFVQFMRNIGEPRDDKLGGGTYGFGKGIFYRLSAAGIVLADSKSLSSRHDRRLMGSAIGASYYAGEQRFTGRHWWGTVGADDIPDPLLDDEAQLVSTALGLPGFLDGETGTDVIVVGAKLGSMQDEQTRTAEQAATFLASSILWHLWPKMVGDSPARMEFKIDVDGTEIEIPNPRRVDAIAPFVVALEHARRGEGVRYSRTVAPKSAGILSVEVDGAGPVVTTATVEAAKPFVGRPRHIARMRQAELVVDYLEGPEHPNTSLQYGGVFLASEEADAHFAAAEPPTHDTWEEKGLTGASRGVVVGAKSFIRRQFAEIFTPSGFAGQVERVGVAALSARLGTMIAPAVVADPAAASRRRAGRPRTSVKRDGTAQVVEAARLVDHELAPYLVAKVSISSHTERTVYRAEARVKLNGGGTESVAPLNSNSPSILQWLPVAGGDPVHGTDIAVEPGHPSDWWVYATFVPLVVVEIAVRRVPQ